MGDVRRFDLFASYVGRHVPDRNARIADVAAGKGYLSLALRERGFRNVIPFEPRPRKGGQVRRLGIRVQLFEPTFARDFDVLVGMHPDGATDCILSGAAIGGCLAIVCPCCVRPNAWTYWGNTGSFRDWTAHLVKRSTEAGLQVREGSLPMTGRNLVLMAEAA